MNQPRLSLQIGDISRADFRTSLWADTENSRIQKLAGFQYRYQPARLAIGLSLRDASPPRQPDETTGKPIKGDTLFGQDEADLASWVALVVQHSRTLGMTRKEFQDAISGHWERGIRILATHAACDGRVENLVVNLLGTLEAKKLVVDS